MKIREHYQTDEDIAEADAWLDKRAMDIDGDMNLVNFKDRIIASVCASAERKGKRKKEEGK